MQADFFLHDDGLHFAYMRRRSSGGSMRAGYGLRGRERA
jgi:hypothetical protein